MWTVLKRDNFPSVIRSARKEFPLIKPSEGVQNWLAPQTRTALEALLLLLYRSKGYCMQRGKETLWVTKVRCGGLNEGPLVTVVVLPYTSPTNLFHISHSCVSYRAWACVPCEAVHLRGTWKCFILLIQVKKGPKTSHCCTEENKCQGLYNSPAESVSKTAVKITTQYAYIKTTMRLWYFSLLKQDMIRKEPSSHPATTSAIS